MTYQIDNQMQFPIVEFNLGYDERVLIQRGSMIYHHPDVDLTTQLNASGSGLGKLVKSVARSLVSNESAFIVQAHSRSEQGKLAIASSSPGEIMALEIGQAQYFLNDGAFLAMQGDVSYTLTRQSLGKAFLSGQGGFYIMSSQGMGTLLVNGFGSIKKIHLNNEELTVDNGHVLAWSQDLDYHVHLENGFFQSMGTGEGVVNTFRGTGDLYIQSLNIEGFADLLAGYLPHRSGD